MDGHFVPNITFGPFILSQIKKITKIPMDVHLMIENPTNYIADFVKSGADMITVHAETEYHLHRTLQYIRSFGVKAGVSVNPHTPVNFIPFVGDMVDLVLVMSVNPGFGGQAYIKSATKKIEELKKMREENNFHYEISVDGGVNNETLQEVKNAGADIVVMGSYFFGTIPEKRKEIVNLSK